MTLSETVHELLAAMDPPDRLIPVVPPVAVTVPLQLLLTFGLDEIVRPVGNVSLNATPCSVMPFVFEMRKLSVVLPFRGIVGEAKVFRIEGGDSTCRVSVKLLQPAVGSQTIPLLTLSPEVDGVTVTLKTHEPPAGKDAPVMETPVAVTVIAALLLPQVAGLAEPGVPVSPVGKVSVRVTLSGGVTGMVTGFGFWIVKNRLVAVLTGT